jgi:hypothetical protein
LLIVSIVFQTTSQFWIMAAFKINQDYIAENLCINRFDAIPLCKGSCFLEDQLIKDQKEQQKSPELKLKEINLFCDNNFVAIKECVFDSDLKNQFNIQNENFISSSFLLSVFRPPAPIV